MDITILFGACVKTLKTTNKFLGVKNPKTQILKSTARDPQLKAARDVVKQISNLQKFFIDNKVAYLNVVNYLSTNKTMTESDRAEIDMEAQKIINTCTTMINEYKKALNVLDLDNQLEEHYTNIIDSVDRYLKNVSKTYTEAKAIRVKKVIDMHKISKLETSPKKSLDMPQLRPTVENVAPQENINNELSTEEMQMFESENDMLYTELNSLSDEVKQMETKVVHIAELQELFTEKVLQQEKDIDRISNIVAATTDDVKDANEQIRQAIQRNAGLRVYVLFFLLVMSFSLLFLDWYND